MKNLLIISKDQFGYHTDISKWCEYLRDDFSVTTLTFDDGNPKVGMDGVRNLYVPGAGSRSLRGVLFMLYAAFTILFFRGTILIRYFKESILFKKLFPWKRMILDIRTLDISEDKAVRTANDRALKKCADAYDFLTCISEGVRERAGIPKEKSAILPLGADVICPDDKNFDKLRLLYVGTFYNRKLELTILALAKMLEEAGPETDIEYDMIGDGPGKEREQLEALVEELGLRDKVHFHGYVRHDLLGPYFEKANVGVSFVPMTGYYEYQPPTKTFEYALSGMYIIATDTFANREVVTEENGILIKDTVEDFAAALLSLHKAGDKPDSAAIRDSMKNFRWQKIVKEQLKPVLDRLKILHITTNYPTPDHPIFGIFVKEQVESIQRLGQECEVFYCDGKNRGFRQYMTYVPKLWWKIARGHYDVLHFHHALSAVIGCLTLWPFFKKCVLSYQNDPSNEWGNGVFRFFNLFFNAFIFKNNPGQYSRFFKVHYLPNGCDQDFFVPMDKAECRGKLGWDPQRKYVIYMDSNKGARSQKRKDRFDETLGILRTRYGYDIEGVIMRNVARDMVPVYFNAADLHLLTSDFEGSPNSVKECMCCNTPVVSTDVGNVREMIGDIPGSYVVDGFTAEALADACAKVFKDERPFEGREPFLAKGYGMSAVAEKLNGIYTKL